MKDLKVLFLLSGLIIGLLPSVCLAASLEKNVVGARVLKDLRLNLDQPVPDIQELLPGYSPPPADSISIMIGDFACDGLEDDSLGSLLGTVLRWKVMGTPGSDWILVPLDSETLRKDLWKPNLPREEAAISLESLALSFDRYGSRHALAGHCSIGEKGYELDAILHSLPSQKEEHRFHESGPLEDLPAGLSRLALELHKELGAPLTEEASEWLSAPSPGRYENFEQYLRLQKESGEMSVQDFLAEAGELLEESGNFPLAVLPFKEAVVRAQKVLGEDYNAELMKALDKYPNHPAVLTQLLPAMETAGSPETSKWVDARYEEVLVKHPNYLAPLLNYSQRKIHTSGDPAAGLALAIQATRSFPRDFRSWLYLSQTCRSGIDAFEKIRVQGRSDGIAPFGVSRVLFTASQDTLEKSLWMCPHSPDLWRASMRHAMTAGGSGVGYLEAFEKAVEYGPREAEIYSEAHYLLNLWNIEDPEIHLHILEKAVENIPDRGDAFARLFRATGVWVLNNWIGTPDQFRDLGTLAEAARIVALREESLENYYNNLKIFILSGDRESATAYIRRAVEAGREENRVTGWAWTVSEKASLLGELQVARELIDKIEPASPQAPPNYEDLLESYRALLLAREGDVEKAKAILETRAMTAEDNLYSRLRYIELGLEHPLDPKVEKSCLEYLIDYAPPAREYPESAQMYSDLSMTGELPEVYQDLMRSLTEGHRAWKEGDYSAALKAYSHADRAKGLLARSGMPLPEVEFYLWRSQRRVAGLN
jgi:hypothetical protein